MPGPVGLPVIDTMIGFPHEGSAQYDFIRKQTKDRESKEDFEFPVEYMFKDVPQGLSTDDPVSLVLQQMDRFGIEKAMIGVGEDSAQLALKTFPDRFVPSGALVDPNDVVGSVNADPPRLRAVRYPRDVGVPRGNLPAGARSTTRRCTRSTPPASNWASRSSSAPASPARDFRLRRRKFTNRHRDVRLPRAGIRHPPRLRAVGGAGRQADAEVAEPLLLDSAFAPKHYPKAIIDYANTRGADKIIYAGYFPMGLSLERIFSDMPNVPFKDEVWPKFLYGNAARILGLEG